MVAGELRPNEPVVTLGGGTSTVVWVHTVSGQGTMYNLTVAHDHTYAVGAAQTIVHNLGCWPSGPMMAAPGGTGGSGAGSAPQGTIIIVTALGYGVPVPASWPGRLANNGKGLVFQQPGAVGNANMIRIMDPTALYPQGYLRYYNQYGQPLDMLGKPGGLATTHFSLDILGGVPGYYQWLQGFVP